MDEEDQTGTPASALRVFKVELSRATQRGRWLGAQLRQYREDAKLSGATVAKRVRRSPATLSRWESGELVPRPAEVHYMLSLYGVDGAARTKLVRHAEEPSAARALEVDVSEALADHAWLENRAWRYETFQNDVIPGLLQIAGYARAILKARDRAATSEFIESAIEARSIRQRRLTGKEPLELFAILDEAVVRRLIGGPDVMRAQREHLIEQAALPNVEIRVLPFSVGAHASPSGSFDIIRFRDEQDLVYLETHGGHMYLDRPEPFAAFADAWLHLDAVALSVEESIAMIAGS